MPLSASAKFALAQLDPFDTKCLGAKIPDSNSIPSIANSDTDILPLTVSEGLEAMAFRPTYTWAVVTAAGAPSNVSWGQGWANLATNRQKRSNVGDVAELIRPVAHAVRLTSPIAPTNAQGFVHIGLSTETVFAGTTWSFPTTIAEMANLANYRRVTLASLTQSPLTIINKWIDDTAFRYTSPVASQTGASPNEIQTDYGWATIIVMCEGVNISPSTLSVEHCLMTEFIPQKNAVIVGTAAAPNEPGVMAATSTMIGNQPFVHTESEQDSYVAKGAKEFYNAALEAGALVRDNVAIPILERVGSAVGTGLVNSISAAIHGTGGLPGVNANPARLMLT